MDCSFLELNLQLNNSVRQQGMAIAIILVVLCLPTIVLNFLLWMTVIAKRHLQHPAYMIIANLALSDWLAGCISFPTYAVMCLMEYVSRDTCSIAFVAIPISYVLASATYLTVSFQAIERFIAVFYPFQYRIWVTRSVVMISSLVIWLVSCGGVICWTLSRSAIAFNIFIGTIILIVSSIDIFCYYKVYTKTKKIEKQIANQAKLSSGNQESRSKLESKVARVTAMAMINVFVCYTPQFGSSMYPPFSGKKSAAFSSFLYWSWVLLLMNSFINPLITYLQLTVIRKAVFGKIPLFGGHINRNQAQ